MNMIKLFNKLLLFFMLIGYPQLVYSQSIPNFNLSINNSSVQGYCAPQDIEIPVTWPSSNDSTTEYIFILHDDIEPFDPETDPASFSLYETFSFFHSDSLPENIIISFNSSSCNANNSSYALTYYVKDLTIQGIFHPSMALKLVVLMVLLLMVNLKLVFPLKKLIVGYILLQIPVYLEKSLLIICAKILLLLISNG